MSQAPPPQSLPASGRMTLVDGLRGLAACMVVVFHFCMAARLPHEPAAWMPDALEWVLEHGWLGVQLFFVLSGFVIAYSVRRQHVTGGYIGRFALRRAIRLDPPYWTIVLLEAAFVLVLGTSPEGKAAVVSAGQVLSHLVYLQGFLGHEQLVGVFWTLCVEVQLYLAFAGLLLLAQRLTRTRGEAPRRGRQALFLLPFAPLTAASLWWLTRGGSAMPWGLGYWYMFFLGALAWWALDGLVGRGWLFALVGAVAASAAFVRWEPMAAVAVGVALLLYAAGRRGALARWLAWEPLQALGRISYSLYLVHLTLGDRTLRVVLAAYGRTPVSFVLGSLLALLVSLAAALLLHRFLERPAMGWARRVTLERAPRAEASAVAPVANGGPAPRLEPRERAKA